MPAGVATDKHPARERVGKLVGIDVRAPASRGERGIHVAVPEHIFSLEQLLLGGAEDRGYFHDVERGSKPLEKAEVVEDPGGELSGAGTGFDDVPFRLRAKPRGDRPGQRGVEPRPRGKIARAAHGADPFGVVAEIRMVERGLHEPLERDAPAAFQILQELPDHGFVSDSSFWTSACQASL